MSHPMSRPTRTLHPLPVRTTRDQIGLEEFAHRCGLHPALLRRFVALGLVPAVRDRSGRLWFSATQVEAVARLQRLRATLPLNYAALGLVVDLLDRIAELEAALRRRDSTERAGTARPTSQNRTTAGSGGTDQERSERWT